MTTGIVLLNFGEPSEPDRDVVHEYLTRIFYDNADLEDAESDDAARERARELAGRRLPSLLEEYEQIGGSPLQEQASAQTDALSKTLSERGHDVELYHAMQYMKPLVPDVARKLERDEIDSVVTIPIYPLCGPSTTVSSIDSLESSIEAIDGFDPDVAAITGWHRVPAYNRLRAEGITTFLEESELDLQDPDTAFVFSAHGTPLAYLNEGSRYDQYVDEHAETIARIVGINEYEIGYQNHENRDIPWTEPDTETVIEGLEGEAERVVVEPMSFMHEQSETLVELDVDLREDAEALGLDLYRVPVPHDDPRFPELLADAVEPFLSGFDPSYYQLRQCECRNEPGSYCYNAGLPPR